MVQGIFDILKTGERLTELPLLPTNNIATTPSVIDLENGSSCVKRYIRVSSFTEAHFTSFSLREGHLSIAVCYRSGSVTFEFTFHAFQCLLLLSPLSRC